MAGFGGVKPSQLRWQQNKSIPSGEVIGIYTNRLAGLCDMLPFAPPLDISIAYAAPELKVQVWLVGRGLRAILPVLASSREVAQASRKSSSMANE